jgi:hypothetical protein
MILACLTAILIAILLFWQVIPGIPKIEGRTPKGASTGKLWQQASTMLAMACFGPNDNGNIALKAVVRA